MLGLLGVFLSIIALTCYYGDFGDILQFFFFFFFLFFNTDAIFEYGYVWRNLYEIIASLSIKTIRYVDAFT